MKNQSTFIFILIFGVIGPSCNEIDLTVNDANVDVLTVTETPKGGAVLNFKWGIDRITWSYEPSTEYPEFMPDITYALHLWQDHTTELLFEYDGERNPNANLYFVNVLNQAGIYSKKNDGCSFMERGSNSNAFSCLGQDVPGRELQSDDQIKVFIASESKGRDLKFVLAHETGHALGLAHTVTCQFDINPIMYSGGNPCNSTSTYYELHDTDIEALQVHYAN